VVQLPPFVSRVGVFVNATVSTILQAVERCGLDTVQLHGDEPPELCQQLGRVKCIKAFRMRNAASVQELPHYVTDAWLLDSHVRGRRGGTGSTFNWDLAVEASHLGRPILLAGGLNPANVAEAVRLVRPYGVDVSSGVESAPGRKDPKRVREFVQAVRGVRT
jgi:phosphoribosylanthranilate isomerase